MVAALIVLIALIVLFGALGVFVAKVFFAIVAGLILASLITGVAMGRRHH